MQHIGFATSHEDPQGTADDRIAAQALQRRGVPVTPVIWDRLTPACYQPDILVIRSCWNYHLLPDEFLAWLASVESQGTRLLNSRRVITWNYDKHYLQDLAARGIALPKTVWLNQGADADLAGLLDEHEMDEVVIKPAISLSAYETWRTSQAAAKAAQPAFARLVAQRSVLVQTFLPEVMSAGEVSLIFFGDTFSHAVLKRPQPGDFRVQADFGGTRNLYRVTPQLIDQAAAILRCVDEPLLFARVDGVVVGGDLLLMELELIDPVLFFAYDPAAADRFAERLIQQLQADSGAGSTAR